MTRAQAILLTLVAYNIVLVLIGLWASRLTKNNADFFLGGRRLGPWVAAISASASSSSAWTLLGVSGAAYVWGISALWLFPATLLGFVVNWVWVAPRLRRVSRIGGELTLTEVIAGDPTHRLYPWIVRLASSMILVSFIFYISAQFQAAGGAFTGIFGLPMTTSIVLGAGVILLYILLGGFWAVSVTDTLQGLLMAVAAVFLPGVALVAAGGWGALAIGLEAVGTIEHLSVTGSYTGVTAFAFVLGTLGIGLGYPGQPHVVNRFMALQSERALVRGRIIAIGWAMIVYAGMLLLGLCARVLFDSIADPEQVLFEVADRFLAPVTAGVMIAAVLSAVMSTADSQLLVATSAVSHDWQLPKKNHRSTLWLPRIMVLLLSAAAVFLAIYAPATIFSRVLFAWHALGSAFGPLLVLRLCGYTLKSGAILASMTTGFGLTLAIHWLPDMPGDLLERTVPLGAALLIAFTGRK